MLKTTSCLLWSQGMQHTTHLEVQFTIIFIIEAVLKLIAYGKSYFENSWNKFDFFVVSSSILDIVMQAMDS